MNEKSADVSGASTPSIIESRRRFLGKGAIATPAVLTLASTPALATNCVSPSRAMSQHASANTRPDKGTCTGQSPGNYKAQTNPSMPSYFWPRTTSGALATIPPSAGFHSIFSGSRFGSRTLLQVLNIVGSPDPQQVAFHLIGAYLNCINKYIPVNVLTPAQVKAIYTAWDTTGGYSPYTGAPLWTGEQIVTYLKTNRIAP